MKPRLDSSLVAYVGPFALFVAFLALVQIFESIGISHPNLPWLAGSKYWLYPLQTLACGAMLALCWKNYSWRPFRPWLLGVGAGLIALLVWVCPQVLFHAPPRTAGFDPFVFHDPFLDTLSLIARFVRLVIVVPLIEEIFWRGFLLRFFIRDDFRSVPFGTWRPIPFFLVAILFTFEHGSADWPAAFVTGLLYNLVAVRTRSLSACVLAHAVTNAGLGLYVMTTRQWGFW